jgi:hypothetical protein
MTAVEKRNLHLLAKPIAIFIKTIAMAISWRIRPAAVVTISLWWRTSRRSWMACMPSIRGSGVVPPSRGRRV